MRRDAATERQVQAADPTGSTWLSANAGSGKTRVLTDRVARLLLNGVEPQRILCLTYTKAAASEMQNRLFARLGSWAMLEDAALRTALLELGAEGAIGHETLAAARRLFARAIETPGGLRIQTIHSFCAALLRRFPLEAGVSPRFSEMEDRAAKILRADVLDELAEGEGAEAVAGLARLHTGEDLDALLVEIVRAGARLSAPVRRETVLARLGLDPDETEAAVLSSVFLGGEAAWLAQVVAVLERGSSTDLNAARQLAAVLAKEPDLATLAALEGVFLTKKDAAVPFAAKIGSFPTKATRLTLGPLLAPLENLMARVEAARTRRIGLIAADRMLALHRFAALFVPRFALRKAERGLLDFDDLIARAVTLLTDPAVAQWVLFRLDGGIDHILVDEAQDTSPEQWRVIELLAQEFTAGAGAREVARTIFVVGDKKQSIYSFQGADLDAFDQMKAHFRARLAEVETHLADLTLEHSFRSSAAILRLVDLCFDPAVGRDLAGEVKHIAFRSDLPGRVDLWPAIAPVKDPEPENWFDPTDLIAEEHHTAQLARRIAGWIAGLIARGERIPLGEGKDRPVEAGDVLILVQRRSVLFHEIIRACKAEGLPIAGADRLKLGAELAVKDLTALLSFLATPEDDLSLAAVLRSPLCGWSEAELFRLAHGRTSYLWTALREAPGHDATLRLLHDLRDQADYLRPYDLLARVLIRHDGRRKLLARLGEEAEEGIDALMAQALAYERSDVPSLTGFVAWMQAEEVEVKRQMDAAGGRIRVMTVHGAKGLEAPIVILPETQDRRLSEGSPIIELPDGTVAWKSGAAESPEAIRRAIEARKAKAAAERLRLLYVALTRAQCWLVVAAAGETRQEDCWYGIVEAGMGRAGAVPLADGTRRLEHGVWPEAGARAGEMPPAEGSEPGWLRAPVPAAVAAPVVLSPSDLGGPKALDGEGEGPDEAEAKREGSELHVLLEHLPGRPEADWERLAEALIPEPDRRMARLAEARAVIAAPGMADLFAPGGLAEAGIAGAITGRPFLGSIDRLIVEEGCVRAIDYKSNRRIPDRPEDVPEGILRQMGAYAALLGPLYPGRRIETAILWTKGPRLMPLPGALIMAALQKAGFP